MILKMIITHVIGCPSMTSNRDLSQVALSCKTDSEVGSQENSNLKKHLNVASYASPPKQILSVCGATCITLLTGPNGFLKNACEIEFDRRERKCLQANRSSLAHQVTHSASWGGVRDVTNQRTYT